VAPASAGQGQATQVAGSLRELAQGDALSAQVVARDGQALLVRTAAGTTLALTNLASVLEQANVAVLTAALKLQLNPDNPQQASVTAVNGAALQPPVAALAQPPTAAQLALAISPPQPGAGSAPQLPVPGQALTAVVVPQPVQVSAAGAAPPPAAALPPGSQLQLVVQSVAPPATAAVTTSLPATTAGQVPVPAVSTPVLQTAAAAPATPSTPAPTVTAVQATLQGATRVSPPVGLAAAASPPAAVPSLSALPPAIAAQSLAAPPPDVVASGPVPAATVPAAAPLIALPAGTTLSGTVTGQNQAGQVLLNTPQGLLALTLPQILPPGTQVTLELSALVRPPAPQTTTLGPAPLAGVLTRLQGEWPALQQTLDAVRAADPALAQRLQDQLLPQPNVRLAATALQFMAAAAAGSAQAWLGSEAVRKLQQQGKGDLLRKLDDDFRDLGRLNQRQGDNDWQALVMPMLIGGRVEPIQIFMRRRRDEKRKQSQTRFLIDFNLESTGPIQFDGFISLKQLDLILRSESDFGPAFRLDVTAIFEEAIAITGLTGSIRFHGRERPLDWPSPELQARGPTTELKA